MRDEQRNDREIIHRLPKSPSIFVLAVVLNHNRGNTIRQRAKDETDRNGD